jgi:hypothetical protein
MKLTLQIRWAALVGMLALTRMAAAGPGINAEYSADQIIETEDGITTMKVYSTPTAERREMKDGADTAIMITRYDQKVVWNLIPDERIYMTMPMGGADDKSRDTDITNYRVEGTPMGEETLNGVTVNKAKILMTDPDGSRLGGFSWTTSDGIIVKLDAISVDKGGKDRMKLEMRNLQVGPQPKELFELPSGYEQMDLGGKGMIKDLIKGGLFGR